MLHYFLSTYFPNTTVLHQKHPPPSPSPRAPLTQHSSCSRKKTRTSSEMEQYEQLLQKHREIQEAIQQAKSDVITASHNLLNSDPPPPDRLLEVRGHHHHNKHKSRSRSRSGSQSDVVERLEQVTGRKEVKLFKFVCRVKMLTEGIFLFHGTHELIQSL